MIKRLLAKIIYEQITFLTYKCFYLAGGIDNVNFLNYSNDNRDAQTLFVLAGKILILKLFSSLGKF
jgi:hypothetical protein